MSFIQRLLAIILGILLAPLRLLGLGPSPDSAQSLAAQALSDRTPAMPALDDEEAYPLGTLIREHAVRMTMRRPDPKAPALAALPGRIAAWLSGLTQDQLSTIHAVPARLLEEHCTAGGDGRLVALLGAVPDAGLVPGWNAIVSPHREGDIPGETYLDGVWSDLGISVDAPPRYA